MVTYLFPPLDCGVGRQVNFVKYLPRYGWTPVVLSVKHSFNRPVYDPSRGRGVPRDTEVHRTFSLEVVPVQSWIPTILGFNSKWVRPVDPYVGWIPFAYHKGSRILRDGDVDLIYSTSRPNTSHLIALLLKKRYRIPWIADFRDAWTQNPYINYPPPIKRIEDVLERRVIESSDKVMTITDSIKNGFLEKYREQPRDKFVVVPHGGDPDDFKMSTEPPSRFTLVYVGSLYGRRVDVTKVFLDAVRDLLCENQEIELSILFVGNARRIQDEVDLRGLEKVVTLVPHVPHEEAIRYMLSSHALLLIPGSSSEMSGKLVEYLQSGKPILALSHEGSTVSKIVESTETGVVVDPQDRRGIMDQILWFHYLHKIGSLRTYPDPLEVEKYDVRRLTERVSHIFNRVQDTSRRGSVSKGIRKRARYMKLVS